MMAGEETTIALNGVRLAAKRYGDPGGQRVLGLHGWLDNAATFDALAPLLSGVDLITLDLPGHGRSDHLGLHRGFHFVDWVPWVLGAASALGWQRYGLLGHSMGGAVSCLVAATVPGRVSFVINLDGLGPLSAADQDAPTRLRRFVLARERLEQATPESRTFQTIEEAVSRRAEAEIPISLEAARPIVERALETSDEGFEWRTDPSLGLGAPTRLTEAQVVAFLTEIRCPMLLVRPDAGIPIGRPAYLERVAAVKDIEVVEVAGSHYVHSEAAPAVAGPCLDFLAQRPSQGVTR